MHRLHCFIIALLTSLCAYSQYNVDRLIVNGRSALYYEDYVLAIQHFNRAVNAKPYLYEPWYYRALAKYFLDDFYGAEQDVSAAMDINPYIDSMYELRALCRIRQKKYDEAILDAMADSKWKPIRFSN